METLLESNIIALDVPQPSAATTASNKKPKRPRAHKVESQNVHYALVFEAAQMVTEIFKTYGISCAVFGSLASKLYGSSRCPKDVDLLVSQELGDSPDSSSSGSNSGNQRQLLTPQELKDLILRSNPRNFYLKMPRDPSAEYRIMWYRQQYRGPECKVDILVPGIMHLPHLRPERVLFIEDIPVVPFALLLLHKLQGWDDHCKAEEQHKKQKQHQDAADVKRLMGLRHQVQILKDTIPWVDEELFNDEFWALTMERVKAYCAVFPDRADDWKALGFEIDS